MLVSLEVSNYYYCQNGYNSEPKRAHIVKGTDARKFTNEVLFQQ